MGENVLIGESFCCNYPECNEVPVPSKLAIKCYMCDSRINGLTGCSTLDILNPYVYESGSSNSFEACATIIGVEGQDPLTNISYSAFTIRTIIAHCENQSLGIVSYGGATFRGRINCCWTNLCNVESESS
ncbi:unnamed protein product [Rotaria sp. Silwood1]|nr:unnamed protein product [Rotaria sp. Silwood1]